MRVSHEGGGTNGEYPMPVMELEQDESTSFAEGPGGNPLAEAFYFASVWFRCR